MVHTLGSKNKRIHSAGGARSGSDRPTLATQALYKTENDTRIKKTNGELAARIT